MNSYKTYLIIAFLLAFATLANAQCSIVKDSLEQTTQLSLSLKLEHNPIKLNINSKEINEENRPIYIFNQVGMYEQYAVTNDKSIHLMPYKAHYPAGIINYTGANQRRDSFNPHGVDDIGSALLNGLINGVLFGNKY